LWKIKNKENVKISDRKHSLKNYYKNREKRIEKMKKYRLENKNKIKQITKKYYDKHSQERRDYSKKYRLNNKEKIKRYNKLYRSENKEKINKKQSQYWKNYYKSNINFKISHNLRSRLNSSLQNNQKVGSAVKDLGCTIDEFRFFISSKFIDGMSWENYGSWHLNHIIPLCRFDLCKKEDFLKACNYTNYQPLWAIDNLIKNKF